jgi:hypothetical protein
MEEMKAEVPSSALDMLIILTLADQRLADAKREPTGTNLVVEAELILEEYMKSKADPHGRIAAGGAMPPRQVFVHGIDKNVSVSSEQIVKFLVGFWRLPHCISLYVVHVLDVRLQQLLMSMVPPDKQVLLGSFNLALDNQRRHAANLSASNIRASGGVGNSATHLYLEPLRGGWPEPPRARDRFPEPRNLQPPEAPPEEDPVDALDEAGVGQCGGRGYCAVTKANAADGELVEATSPRDGTVKLVIETEDYEDI